MTFFSGNLFFVWLFVVLLPAAVLGLAEKSLRIYRYLATFLFLFLVYRSDLSSCLYLLFYLALSVVLTKGYLHLRTTRGRRALSCRLFVAAALVPLVVYKICALFGASLFGFLGISYLCFRVIQVLIEIYDGVITSLPVGSFLLFLSFFPALSSGPIDRSRRFLQDHESRLSREDYAALLYRGLYKLLLGAFYKYVCSEAMYYLLLTYLDGLHRPALLIAYAYVYGLYLFFDFAGYSSMAVGASYVLGIRMPDNFHLPFLATDLRDFWNRWHITLSAWFRDFVFTRFLIASARKKRFKSRLTGASCGLILNMLLMGLWHGLTPHYILYGFYHGVLLALTEVWQKKSAFYKKHRRKPLYLAVSWFVNLNVVMFGFLIFSGYLTETVLVLYERYF